MSDLRTTPDADARAIADHLLRRAVDGILYNDIAEHLYETGAVELGKLNALADEIRGLIGTAQVGLPTLITTAEQLRALPVGTVLLDSEPVKGQPPRAWSRMAWAIEDYADGTRRAQNTGNTYPFYLAEDRDLRSMLEHGPFRVLHTPPCTDCGEPAIPGTDGRCEACHDVSQAVNLAPAAAVHAPAADTTRGEAGQG